MADLAPAPSSPAALNQAPADPAPDDATALIAALAARARDAALTLAVAETSDKDRALALAAQAVRDHAAEILAANAADLAGARARGLSAALLDRLALDETRVAAIARGLEEVALLPDPVGTVLADWTRPNGLHFQRVRVPLGVIGVIYESRPNVTADAGGLCLKAGNAAILRGGSESAASSAALGRALTAGIVAAGLPAAAVQLVPTSDRAAVGALLRAAGLIDVIVPRGGPGLVARVLEESRVPVFAHLTGLCHVYLHAAADPAKALAVTLNAKMRRTGVCGAAETLLCDRSVAPTLLPPILAALLAAGCELRGDPEICALEPRARPAAPEDWDTEYLDAILTVGLVDGVDAAVAHVNRHGSHHTDAIVTEDEAAAARFLARIDSGIVLHNASTQFADGGEFGFGAEIGIATGKLHARGPVGAEQLTSYKYLVRGNGQIRP